jgi:outer membrane lipoprotein SlyB
MASSALPFVSASMSRLLILGAALAGTLGLAACATTPGPDGYSPYEAGSIARVEEGTIVSVRPVRFGQQQNGSGAAVGGLAGAAVGSQFGGDTGGHIAGAVIGGLLGAVVGDAVQDGKTTNGFAYTIRRQHDGSLIEIPQAEPYAMPVGARVHITYGDRVRVTPAY